ncbi:MAG: hypothetical protein ACREVC_13725 [Burkholderiales bacterium]
MLVREVLHLLSVRCGRAPFHLLVPLGRLVPLRRLPAFHLIVLLGLIMPLGECRPGCHRTA